MLKNITILGLTCLLYFTSCNKKDTIIRQCKQEYANKKNAFARAINLADSLFPYSNYLVFPDSFYYSDDTIVYHFNKKIMIKTPDNLKEVMEQNEIKIISKTHLRDYYEYSINTATTNKYKQETKDINYYASYKFYPKKNFPIDTVINEDKYKWEYSLSNNWTIMYFGISNKEGSK